MEQENLIQQCTSIAGKYFYELSEDENKVVDFVRQRGRKYGIGLIITLPDDVNEKLRYLAKNGSLTKKDFENPEIFGGIVKFVFYKSI